MALAHFKRIADATDLPLIVFQYPLATGQGYPKDTLLKMCEEVPSIRAIKDWIGNVPHHEWHVRTLQNLPRPVNVLTTHSSWLFSSLVLGCNGLLSGSGSVIADLQAKLFRAVQTNDLAEAKRLNDRIEPTARVFYADPFVDMHNRMKEALVLLGKLPRAVVRPPLVKIERAEIARIRQALIEAGLLDKNAAATRREYGAARHAGMTSVHNRKLGVLPVRHQHAAGIMRDAKFRLHRRDHRLRRDPAGPEHRQSRRRALRPRHHSRACMMSLMPINSGFPICTGAPCTDGKRVVICTARIASAGVSGRIDTTIGPWNGPAAVLASRCGTSARCSRA